MSCGDCPDENLLDFEKLENEIAGFVDKSNIEEMLKLQLNELEMLGSMFPNPGELVVYDHSVIADINDFLEGKTSVLPACLDFTIFLTIDSLKLEVCVNLPHEYPAHEPEVFVRNDILNRHQQHDLNAGLTEYITSCDRGDICIFSAVLWLQENTPTYLKTVKKVEPKKVPIKSSGKKTFARYWIYSHHIYSKMKRREILNMSQEYNISGFCLPGKPGIICGEGWDDDCDEWWMKIRSMNWKKIMCKKKEEDMNDEGSEKEKRKFTGFSEISFQSTQGKARDAHMDMGEFYRYLTQHGCQHVFKDYFGVDGKTTAS
ncbi:RWD domain-containing protein 2A [Nilaparvata lugens]|uniref:RWD domain-containing protein 2A n=1 Tax=Nilaparvata lugens TaxID=108931 RepID=UPI000B98C0D4|nr:RWD domain-containing protein 2A [Nilaparvata lugens]